MNLTSSELIALATIAGVIVTLATLIKGVFEYIKQGSQKRAEHFTDMRRRFKETPEFKEIAALIEFDDPKLKELSIKEKRDYLGFLEEIGISLNTGLLKPEIAHYMFGYYAIKCWENENFWQGINRDSIYWSVFRDFVEKMKLMERNFEYNERKMRF